VRIAFGQFMEESDAFIRQYPSVGLEPRDARIVVVKSLRPVAGPARR
jgi:hypothetical protein